MPGSFQPVSMKRSGWQPLHPDSRRIIYLTVRSRELRAHRLRVFPAIPWAVGLVLSGGITTALVAWSCVLWARPEIDRPPKTFIRDAEQARRLTGRDGDFPSCMVVRHQGRGWTIEYVLAAPRFVDSRTKEDSVTRVTAGWPFQCMRGERWIISGAPHPTGLASLAQVPLANPLGSSHIPLIPLWPQFLANTVLFTFVIAGILLVGRLGAHAVRRSRGCCPRCGYRLSARSREDRITCSECGSINRRNSKVFR